MLVAQELLGAGALAENPTEKLAQCLDRRSFTPLHAAIESGQLYMARLLLEKVQCGTKSAFMPSMHACADRSLVVSSVCLAVTSSCIQIILFLLFHFFMFSTC